MRKRGSHTTGKRSKRRVSPLSVVLAGCALALIWGWGVREELYVTPDVGLGYGLGVVGTAMMVLLLLYSVRKRVRFMRSAGPIRPWFSIHMLLGVLGPVAIVFHANFQLGSLNSRVAFFCVMLVAGSGLIGRYIYPKIHHGLFGSRASLAEARNEIESNRGDLGAALATAPAVALELKSFEARVLGDERGAGASLARFLTLPLRIRSLRRRSVRTVEATAPTVDLPEAVAAIDSYLAGIRRVSEFGAYERLFSLWHAFHLPFCVMLFVAAIVHVIAVHMY